MKKTVFQPGEEMTMRLNVARSSRDGELSWMDVELLRTRTRNA